MGGFKGYIIDIISEIRLLYMYINVDNHLNNYVHMCILIQNINVYNKQKIGMYMQKKHFSCRINHPWSYFHQETQLFLTYPSVNQHKYRKPLLDYFDG